MELHWGEITAGAVLGIVIAQLVNHLFAKIRASPVGRTVSNGASRERKAVNQNAAASEFKVAFNEALLNLSIAQHTVAHILGQTFRDHEEAYHGFREHVPDQNRKKFDEAWSIYKRYFKANAKHAQDYQFASAQTDYESEQRKVVAALLKELLAFAEEV